MTTSRLLLQPRLPSSAVRTTLRLAVTTSHFSTASSPLSDSVKPNRLPNPQDFVRVRLEPGEWDERRKNPIDRPTWRNNARIMHADDYAMRPRSVMGNGETRSIHDTMTTFGWLNAKQQDTIYQSYLDMCQRMTKSTDGITSHEYIFRVLGQKFNIAANRVAAISVLKHNEEQMKARGEELYYEMQDFIDEKIAGHIQDIYSVYREENPQSFVEHTVGNPSLEATDASFVGVDDLVDVDGILAEIRVRERDEARISIDTHVYKEDVDEDTISVKLSPAVRKIMAQQAKWSTYDSSQRRGDLKPLPGAGAEPRRLRWKYTAKFEEVRTTTKSKKNNGKKAMTKKAARATDNTVVELDGLLRAASVKEAKGCAWKPKRNGATFVYQTLQDAWLNRQSTGSMKVWGRQEAPLVVPAITEGDHVTTATITEGDNDSEPGEPDEQVDSANEKETQTSDGDDKKE